MADYQTSKGRNVRHCHIGPPTSACPCEPREWTAAEKDEQRALLAADYPNLVEVYGPSRKYNCHGYVYARSHGWFCRPGHFIEDDYSVVPMNNPREGDVLIYKLTDDGFVTHSARVVEVVDGEIRTVRSKWGKMGVLLHDPDYVPLDFYGYRWRLLRKERSSAPSASKKKMLKH